MDGQEGWLGQATGDARREQSKADAGSPSNWDVTTVERFSSRKGRIWCGWRELLRSTGDERGLRLSHCGAVSFKWSSGSHQCPKNNWCRSSFQRKLDRHQLSSQQIMAGIEPKTKNQV